NPNAWKAVIRLSRAVGDDARAAGLSEQLIELVNLRVSQMNGCAYCLDLHTRTPLMPEYPLSDSGPWPHGGKPRSSTLHRNVPHCSWLKKSPTLTTLNPCRPHS